MADAIKKMRTICAKLPDVTEASHHGRIAFKAGGKLFATAGAGIIALQPDAERRKKLLASGIATPYARDKRAVEIDVSGKVDWKLIEQCVFDSYGFVVGSARSTRSS
jgi:hypothetical protein